MRTKLVVPAVSIVAGLALSACGSSSKPTTYVTVTVPPSGASSSAATGTSTGASTGVSASSSVAPGSTTTPGATLTKLPGGCADLLPDYSVSQALGGNQLAGDTAFVVGQPEKSIGRIAYLNCRYGVTGSGSAATAKVEIGVSLYSTAAQAAARIDGTKSDYATHGATAQDVQVSGEQAALLTGGSGDGYDVPLLVVASGQRTVAVTIDSSVATGTALNKDASAVAELALRKTAT